MAIQNKRIILVCAGLAMCNVPVAGPAQAQDAWVATIDWLTRYVG